ncbi:hypothetical protein OPT61_g933 [Boeremia exigua]|uniref:Uncharacterized protein n=1 Tax=Boeremia exigua TaxID=749465 RepID=A0ACC2IS59_9PLEO|nr:hypothetical protein OPT61_g933 [Boeremia exigua]
MPFDIDDDEYVAKLLAQDAKKTSKTYDLVGLDAFNAKRPRPGAPKPNTNFLRHIIRQTDSHNAALLAKEAEESSSRLRQMNRQRERGRTELVDRAKRRIEGRLSPPRDEDPRQRRARRRTDNEDGDDYVRDQKRSHRDESSEPRFKKHRERDRSRSRDRSRDRSKERHRRKRSYDTHTEDRTPHKPRRSGGRQDNDCRSRRDREGKDADKSRHRSRRKRRSHSRSRSRSPHRESHRRRDRSRSPKRVVRSPTVPRRSRRQSATSASDSDPLEAIVGPLPAPSEPAIRSRGRGAMKANSLDIESRFSVNYDPSMDVRPSSDAEDDWDEALEAMRDRERWKQQGADRLRAAGFKDEQVKKWEKGGDPMEEDVVWAKKGQDREWDRGKVVDEDGDVDLKADWGRLK